MKTNNVCAIIDDELQEPGLKALTARRPKSTLYFDCKYRIIDFALSSISRANVHDVFTICDEKKSRSMMDHIAGGRQWGLDSIGNYQYIDFFQDAIRQKKDGSLHYFDKLINFLQRLFEPYTVFFGNTVIANIDLKELVRIHQRQNANVTAIFKQMPANQITDDNKILSVSDKGLITSVHSLSDQPLPNHDGSYNLALNIYIANTDWLINELKKAQRKSQTASLQQFFFDKLSGGEVRSFEYAGYVCNVYDVKSYFDANMGMLDYNNMNELLYSTQRVISNVRNDVATYYSPESDAADVHIATGCRIYGSVKHSLLSRRTVVGKKAHVENSIIMVDGIIKKNAVIKNAILDKRVQVDAGVKIIGDPDNPLVIPKGMHVTKDIVEEESKSEDLVRSR